MQVLKWNNIRDAMSNMSDTEFYKAADAFLGDEPYLVESFTREQLQALIAPRVDDLFNKVTCDNVDEMTILGDPISDVPEYLKFTVYINGRNYCYYINDLYNLIRRGEKSEPYRRFKFSDEMVKGVSYKDAIMTRYEYLSTVLTEDALKNLSEEEKEANKEMNNRSISRLAIDIAAKIPYFPITPEQFQEVSLSLVYDIVNIIYDDSTKAIAVYNKDPKKFKQKLFLLIEQYDDGYILGQKISIALKKRRDELNFFREMLQNLADATSNARFTSRMSDLAIEGIQEFTGEEISQLLLQYLNIETAPFVSMSEFYSYIKTALRSETEYTAAYNLILDMGRGDKKILRNNTTTTLRARL